MLGQVLLMMSVGTCLGMLEKGLRSSDCEHGIYVNGLGHVWTGFCSCEDDWTGPTCALPVCHNGGFMFFLQVYALAFTFESRK